MRKCKQENGGVQILNNKRENKISEEKEMKRSQQKNKCVKEMNIVCKQPPSNVNNSHTHVSIIPQFLYTDISTSKN